MKKTKRRMPASIRMFYIGAAQQKYSDTKTRLFDDYDYDRISKAEYERKLEEARQEMLETIKWAKEAD